MPARQINSIETRRSLKFGVEIEFTGCNGGTAALKAALEAEGLVVRTPYQMHEVLVGAWKIVSDSSCGYELVSPVLTSLDELAKACKALAAVEAKVNRNCGLHVHHDAANMDAESIKNVYRLYVKHENVLDSMMPESRRRNNNRFCQQVSGQWFANVESCNTMADLKRVLADSAHYSSKRYYKVNFNSYISYGTVEFRQHCGSTNYEKISNWVLLTNRIMDRAIRGTVRGKNEREMAEEAANPQKAVANFFADLDIRNTPVSKYVSKRILKLKKDEVERAA